MPWRELNAGAISGYEVESTVNSNGVRELQLTSRGSSEGWYKLNAEAVSGYNIEINGQDSKGTINFKTDGTLTSRYFPPDNDSVDFQLQSYTAPSNDAADLSLADFGKILIDQSIVTEVTIDGRVTEDLTVEGDTVSSIVDALPAYNSVEDLVAWYRFEDGDARDYATFEYAGDPTAYNGTVSGATYQQFQGVRDFDKGCNSGVYDFSANTTDRVRAPNIPLGTEVTAMAWAKFSEDDIDNNNHRIYFTNSDNNTFDGFAISNYENGGTYFYHSNELIDVGDLSGSYVHVAIRIKESDEYTCFVNGSSEGTQSVSGSSASIDSGNNFTIGNSSETNDNSFNGVIDDVRVYNRALTESEINQIYQATQP